MTRASDATLEDLGMSDSFWPDRPVLVTGAGCGACAPPHKRLLRALLIRALPGERPNAVAIRQAQRA